MDKYDVAVIGGGLTGCAAAFYLARAGARVVLLERGELNLGASGRNAGSLHFQLEHRHIIHASHLAQSFEPLIRLSAAAIADWDALPQQLDADLGLNMHGGLMLAETAEEEDLLRRKYELERSFGLDTELLTAGEARALAPYLSQSVRAAIRVPLEGGCNPRLVTLAFARKASALGALLEAGWEVRALTRTASGWRVQCTDVRRGAAARQLRAEKILNASGAWAGEIGALAGWHLPIFPIALTMSVTEEVAPFIGHLIQHVGRKLSLKQVAAGNMLIGGGWPARLQRRGDGTLAAVPTFQAIRENLRVAASVVPALRDVYLLRTWTGITGVTSDQLPLLGEVGRGSGFFVAAGGAGFTFGPTYARLISETMTSGRASFPLQPYSPDRFDHMNMYMGA